MAIAEGNTKRVRGLRNRGRSTGGLGDFRGGFPKVGLVRAEVMVGIGGSSNGHGGLQNEMGSISDE